MYYKIIILFLLSFVIMLPKANAALVFSEIMYDNDGTDTDHEWVEVYNDSSTAFSLVGVKFNDGANHNLNEPPANGGKGTLSIPAHGYIVIAQNAETFSSDYSGYNGTVIDTVMGLGNTTETIKLVSDSGTTLVETTYDSSWGAVGDGKTLNWNGGQNYVSASPTPGSEYLSSSGTNPTTGGGSTVVKTNTTEEASTKIPDPPKQTIEIISPDNIFKGVTFKINPVLLGYSKEPISYGELFINYGDGTVSKIEQGKTVEHLYQYAGVYTIVLEWYTNSYVTEPELTTSKIIRVEEPGISIEYISGGGIKIKNNSPKIADISDFKISQGLNIFVIPKRTRIVGLSAISISKTVLGFDVSENIPISIFNPFGENIATYPEDKNKKQTTKETIKKSDSAIETIYTPKTNIKEEFNTNQATAVKSNNKIDSKYLWLAVFLLFIASLIGSVIYIKKINEDDEDEYKLLDE